MTDIVLNLRLSSDLVRRADALIAQLAADARVAALVGKPSRSAILRLALTRGLEVLEAEHPEHPEPPPTP